MNIQEYVDKKYPPTHTFYIDSLKPYGFLKERLEIINEVSPNFFMGKRLLDVGCSKGFFSLYASKRGMKVVGLDRNPLAIEICRYLSRKHNLNVNFVCSSFRDFVAYEPFDRIFLGNVAHHLFLSVKGWDWIGKLASYSNGYVLVEGAKDANCRDMKELVPKNLHGDFNKFMYEMSRFFDLIRIVPSVSYTPDRYVMFFKRKPIQKFQLSNLQRTKTIKKGDFWIFKVKLGWFKVGVAKTIYKPMKNPMLRIRMASVSPVSNGLIGEIFENDKYVGWMEKYERSKPYRYFENEHELFKFFCEHQIFLAKNGYVDMDCATINFFKGSNKLFDKSQVYPICDITERQMRNFMINLNQSFKTITETEKEKMMLAFQSGDSRIIQKTFEEIKDELA